MKDSSAATNAAPQSVKPNQVNPVSERKLKANRENAKKSTGPKTLTGKAFSRRNAVKHGLMVNYATDFEALDENPSDYRDLLNGLWDQYQPDGRAEEMEVERIALCYWRLKRAWRYENAINLAAKRDFVRAELNDQFEYCDEREKEEDSDIADLRRAEKEIEDIGEVSQELRQRILASPGVYGLWSELEKAVPEVIKQIGDWETFRKLSPKQQVLTRQLCGIGMTIHLIENVRHRRFTNVRETAIGRHAIPEDKFLDRILRYETTIEKYLHRAIAQLERLQRRRKGETLAPPVFELIFLQNEANKCHVLRDLRN